LTTPGRQGPTGACTAANTTDKAGALIYRRTTEVGPRISEYQTTIFDIQAALVSISLRTWSWTFTAPTARARTRDATQLRLVQPRPSGARRDEHDDLPNTANGCVPLNIFGPEGSSRRSRPPSSAA
jgi:iron complex outermembrane receptor protein